MEESINQFRERHALLLTELKRMADESGDETQVARQRELRGILKVVARSFLRENVDPAVTEDELAAWLQRLNPAA